MEAAFPRFEVTKVKLRAWHDVIDVPRAMVRPSHAGQEFSFEVLTQFINRASD